MLEEQPDWMVVDRDIPDPDDWDDDFDPAEDDAAADRAADDQYDHMMRSDG